MTKRKLSRLLIGALAASTMAGCGCGSSAPASSAGTAEEKTSSNAAVANMATTPHYDVVFRDAAADVDGTIDDVWKDVGDISGSFFYPWESKEAPKTEFKAYNDGTNLYFYFDSEDPDVLVDEEWKDDESTVDNEDRAEIFFAQGPVDKPGADGMPLYYGIEIDPDGRVHDYSVEYYRDFDGKWNLEGLKTAGVKTDDGYIVEGSIPLATLEKLNLLKDNGTLRTGLYRAEFSTAEDGKDEPVMEWISWVDPKTENPDYHVDSSFGELRILKEAKDTKTSEDSKASSESE